MCHNTFTYVIYVFKRFLKPALMAPVMYKTQCLEHWSSDSDKVPQFFVQNMSAITPVWTHAALHSCILDDRPVTKRLPTAGHNTTDIISNLV